MYDGSEHWSIAYTLQFLGELHFDIGNFEKVIFRCLIAFAIKLLARLFNQNYRLQSIERLDSTLASYTKSLEVYNESLAIRQRIYAQRGIDGDHSTIAITLSNIGTTYHLLGHLVTNFYLECHMFTCSAFLFLLGKSL